MREKILDPTCGSRSIWFDKNNKDVLFTDKRTEEHILCDGRTLNISPEIEIDFRDMPFEDNSFYLVVFDPPHLINLGDTSWMAKKYGKLNKSWEEDIRLGFKECLRVLKPNGTLVFKWNENQIKVNKILKLLEEKPLFGHRSGKASGTMWMTFMKQANK